MSGTSMGGPSRMKANRAVVESKCLTCGFSFAFGEDVIVCNVCGGFHHAGCWNLAPICQHNVAGAAAAPAASAGPPPPPVLAPPPPVTPGAPQTPAADEQYCPQCREIIKKEALKCRFCGYILSAQLAAQQINPALEKEVSSAATTAMWCGIVGLLICGPIFGTIAIVQANKAIREIDMNPQLSAHRSKATAGRVMGIIAWVWFAVALIISVAARS